MRVHPFLVFLFACAIVASISGAEAGRRYINPTYGFAVVIPSGLPTTITPPPAPQHGIAAALSTGGHVWIDGSYDALLLGSARAALRDLASDEAVRPGTPLRTTRLANLTAARLRYTRDGEVAVRLVAFRPRAGGVGILYTFGLDTDARHAARDERAFAGILHSFALLPLPK
jgi:hypothetical protein